MKKFSGRGGMQKDIQKARLNKERNGRLTA